MSELKINILLMIRFHKFRYCVIKLHHLCTLANKNVGGLGIDRVWYTALPFNRSSPDIPAQISKAWGGDREGSHKQEQCNAS